MSTKELRLLSLDGGGVRGLSSLYILRNLMEKIDPGAETLPKPCDYFDMIGGTSTGGLIAIMLGRLEMSVDQCIEAYTSLSEEIFAKESKSRFRLSLRGDLKSRFDAERLEKAIMKILNSVGMGKDTLLSSPDAKCKVFVCAASQKNETVVLRSYHSPRDNRRLGYVRIWEACRATSAAQGFFDPIAIPPGKGSELFTDGGIRANNPVKEVWGQACDLWATDQSTSQDGQLRARLRCLISIGTGRPELTTYSTSLKGIVKVLSKIATDTEAVAESFVRDKPELLRDSQYFRFNVERGLKGIGLDECDRLSEITSATSAYLETQLVFSSLRSCADTMATEIKESPASLRDLPIRSRSRLADDRTNSVSPQPRMPQVESRYRIPFKLDGVVHTDKFVSRPEDTARIDEVLLQDASNEMLIFVLHGMGGIGKTQLAINFAYKNKHKYSSVFWVQGQTEDSLRQSLVRSAKRIPKGQISDESRRGKPTSHDEEQDIIDEVLEWLGREDNYNWLLIFDNIDLDPTSAEDRKRGAYSVMDYLPGSHGSVLITSRLVTLSQLGSGRSDEEVRTVDYVLSKLIFENWYGQTLDDNEHTRKLLGPDRLSGLPLAVAQAAVYAKQNRGMSIAEYIRRFDSMWPQVMGDTHNRPLLTYHGAVGVTWALSMEQVREKSEHAANLVCLWAFLDNRDFSFDLFFDVPDHLEVLDSDIEDGSRVTDSDGENAGDEDTVVGELDNEEYDESDESDEEEAPLLIAWLREICRDEGLFDRCLHILQSYRLATTDVASYEARQKGERMSYSMHPLVHRWAMYMQTKEQQCEFIRYALQIFGGTFDGSRNGRLRNMEVKARMWPHVRKALSCVNAETERAVILDVPTVLALLQAVGLRRGDMLEGEIEEEMLYRRILREDIAKDLPAEIRFKAISQLGALIKVDRDQEAEVLLKEARELACELFGEDGDRSHWALFDLAKLSFQREEYDKAEELYKDLLKIVRMPSMLHHRTIGNLAVINRHRNDLTLAASHAQEAFDLVQEHDPNNEDEQVWAGIDLSVISVMRLISGLPVVDRDLLSKTKKVSLDSFRISSRIYSQNDYLTDSAALVNTLALVVEGELGKAETMLDIIVRRQDSSLSHSGTMALRLIRDCYFRKGDMQSSDRISDMLREQFEEDDDIEPDEVVEQRSGDEDSDGKPSEAEGSVGDDGVQAADDGDAMITPFWDEGIKANWDAIYENLRYGA